MDFPIHFSFYHVALEVLLSMKNFYLQTRFFSVVLVLVLVFTVYTLTLVTF